MELELFDQVKDLLVEQLRVRPRQVQLQARIEDDLGATGDDAWELMEAFTERFQVDMTEYKHQEHFGSEGVGYLFFLFGWGQEVYERRYQPVTVEHLVQVAKKRDWFNPP